MIPQPQSVTPGDGVAQLADRHVTSRIDSSLPPEGYTLDVTADGVCIAGGSPAGVFYGTQTFRQLLPASSLRHGAPTGPWHVPAVYISDSPRFRWRGVLLDVARHFMPIADVLRFIDLLAFHKLNVLHLHLTDDQGWRVEVPPWPRLTTVGAWRKRTMLGSSQHGRYHSRPHGGFYTADDLREIVAFAAARHVTIVPEVDMPGHMQAAIAAYPSLGNGGDNDENVCVREAWGISTHVLNMSDATLNFCRDVLDAVCAIFPSEYIGIGGDECPHDEWHASVAVQAKMSALGLPDERALHGWFVGQMAAHLRQQDPPRRAYGWDEIMAAGDAIPADTLVAAWRGAEPTAIAARRGFDVIACPDMSCYLDYRQSEDPGEPTAMGTLLTLKDMYAFEPVPAGLTESEERRINGAQANVWTEHMESAARVDYMVYPRLCAFAEVVWGKPAAGEFADFEKRLVDEHLARLDALGVNYRPLSGPRPWDARPDAPGKPKSREYRLARLAELTADLR